MSFEQDSFVKVSLDLQVVQRYTALFTSFVVLTGEEDEENDALNPEYTQLLRTITREEVDKDITRCPHPETQEKMKAVSGLLFFVLLC